MHSDSYHPDTPARQEHPAIEHSYRSPAPPLDGFSLIHCVEMQGGRLLELWFALGQGAVFRVCVHDGRRGWVPYTQSAPTVEGNVWVNDPALSQITVEAEPVLPRLVE